MSCPFWVICSYALRLLSGDSLCLNQVCWLVVLKTKKVPRASQASREGGCGVAGWQGLKMESGDIVDLTPRARQDPLALRTTPFQEGEDDEDIGMPGQPTICDN
jgi:hypothetical protein